jgi:hypothetical protein
MYLNDHPFFCEISPFYLNTTDSFHQKVESVDNNDVNWETNSNVNIAKL